MDTKTDEMVVSRKWLTNIKNAAYKAAVDMRRTRRTNQYNLTGLDINMPEIGCDKPEIPLLIHQEGLDESEDVEDNLREAVKMMAEALRVETCKSEDADEMCHRCDCWKQTRASCS